MDDMAWTRLLFFTSLLVYVRAHGRMIEPPNRASLWRYGYNSPPDYDDDGMNCGGFYRQYSVNNGKCGICGDAYDLKQPRAHELGGTFGIGYIVAHYEAGQSITTKVHLSASHLGFWELRICPEPYLQTQECFDNGYLLELESGGTKYYPQKGDGSYDVTVRLPEGFTCEHCVLQWQYTAGNNWGFCANGTQGLGCGNQEQFYSCADISIGKSLESNDIDDGGIDKDVDIGPTQHPEVIPIELDLLIRRLQLAGYQVFTGDEPVVSPNSGKKKKNKHRRKKSSKKSKRHKQILHWR